MIVIIDQRVILQLWYARSDLSEYDHYTSVVDITILLTPIEGRAYIRQMRDAVAPCLVELHRASGRQQVWAGSSVEQFAIARI